MHEHEFMALNPYWTVVAGPRIEEFLVSEEIREALSISLAEISVLSSLLRIILGWRLQIRVHSVPKFPACI